MSREGKVLRLLHPEKRTYASSAMPMTEAAIDANGLRHVYVALGEPLADDAWSIRVYYKPFVDWIWAGCILMALGGLLAISDLRYRLKKKRDSARSEEHTSELQSLMRISYAVFCLKKKTSKRH